MQVVCGLYCVMVLWCLGVWVCVLCCVWCLCMRLVVVNSVVCAVSNLPFQGNFLRSLVMLEKKKYKEKNFNV